METVKISKTDLIAKLTENRAAHVAVVKEAGIKYRQKCVDAMRQRADQIEAGADIDVYFSLPKPEDHTEDFDDALAALQWEQGTDVLVSREDEFKKWVLNKWAWERSFMASNASYTARR